MSDIRHNKAQSRFELEADGAMAVAYYRTQDGVMDFTSTQTPPALRNRGIASRLVRGALEAARAEGFKVKASCSFVEAFLQRHKEFADLRA